MSTQGASVTPPNTGTLGNVSDIHGVHIGERSVFREVEEGRICTWETGMLKQDPGSTVATPMDSYWRTA